MPGGSAPWAWLAVSSDSVRHSTTTSQGRGRRTPGQLGENDRAPSFERRLGFALAALLGLARTDLEVDERHNFFLSLNQKLRLVVPSLQGVILGSERGILYFDLGLAPFPATLILPGLGE